MLLRLIGSVYGNCGCHGAILRIQQSVLRHRDIRHAVRVNVNLPDARMPAGIVQRIGRIRPAGLGIMRRRPCVIDNQQPAKLVGHEGIVSGT